MPGVYVGVGCTFVKANKIFVGVGCTYVEVNKVYTAENCNWKVVHEAGGKGFRALVGTGGATGQGLDVTWHGHRAIVALSDDTVAFAVNEFNTSTSSHSSTLIKINSKGESQWQRQSDNNQASVTWTGKVTYQLRADSGDNIYQLGAAYAPTGGNKGANWIQKITANGTYQWDRTHGNQTLTGTMASGGPQNELVDLVFNGPTNDEESTFQVEGESNYSQGYPTQGFFTTCSTYNSNDGSLVSYRLMGSSGGTGNANGNNAGRELIRFNDKIYSASQVSGSHKCNHANGPCYNVGSIYRRSLDGQTVDNVGGGQFAASSAGSATHSFQHQGTGTVHTNYDLTYDYPILMPLYTMQSTIPGTSTYHWTPHKLYFHFFRADLDLTDVLRYELTGPATATANTDMPAQSGSGIIWDASNNHIYFLVGHKDFNELSIIEFDVATGTIQNQNRFRITNANDKLMIDSYQCASLVMTSDKFYIMGNTNRFDNTGVAKATQVFVLQVPKDLTKGFGDYGNNLVYEARPANDLYTLSASTEIPPYGGPGGSYYWPIPQTMTNVTQDENTTPTADNIPVGTIKQKN